LNLTFISDYLIISIIIAATLYALFLLIYKDCIICFTDPLNISLLLLSFYTSGLILTKILFDVDINTFLMISALLSIYILVGAFISSRRFNNLIPHSYTLAISKNIQVYLSAFLLLFLSFNLVINYFLGVMPLFKGTEARTEMGSAPIPSMVLLSFSFSHFAVLLAILSEYKTVKYINIISICIGFITAVLGGSKSSIFMIIIILMEYDYILHLIIRSNIDSIYKKAIKYKIIKVRRILVLLSALALFALPFYLQVILVGDSAIASLRFFLRRLFLGFDGLILTLINDVDFKSVAHLKLYEIYFYPIIRKIGYTPDIQSAGEYVIYIVTNNYYYAKSGLNPNSNFILELLFSQNYYFAIIIMFISSSIIFSHRANILAKQELKIHDIISFFLTVLTPFGLLLDGAFFINTTWQLIILYFLFNTILNIMPISKTGKLIYRFY
jgi:hypothetical protein